MKLNKKQVGLIAGVVCVILLTILLLSMCNNGGQEEAAPATVATEPSETTVPTTEAAVETTEAPAEETVEETTEATEEATESTTGGSSTPGGTGGPGIGSGTGSNTNEPTTPKAGSEESPYMEVVSQFPDTVDTVSVPAGGTVHYHLDLQDESVARYGESLLVIEGENVSVIYNENTYEAVNGIVSVPLIQAEPEEEEEAAPAAEGETGETSEEVKPEEEAAEPISVRICNGGGEARILTLILDAPLGTLDNPEQIRGEDGKLDFAAKLEADDEDGYHFGFVAERDGTLVLQLDKITEDAPCDIIVTAGETTVTIPSDGDTSSAEMEFKKGDSILIQVLAKAGEDGSHPAAEVELSGSADYYGSKTNPIEVEKDFATEEMEPGQVLYYLVKNQKGMALNVEYPAYVIHNDKTYQEELPETEEGTEPENPVLSVKIGNGDEPVLMAIGNGGEEAASFDVAFTYPIGHAQNKETLIIRDDEAEIDGINTAVIEAGDQEVYWFTWTNDMDTGILTLKLPEEGNWKYAVKHTSNAVVTEYEMTYSDSEPAEPVFNIVLKYEDVVDIQVCTYDPADKDALVIGSVEMEASFVPHTLIASEGETFLTVEAGSMIYCKQGLKKADGAIMTVVAVEADEEGNAKLDENGEAILLTDRTYTIDYEGTVYTAEGGKIVVEGIEMDSNDPDIFSFRNDGKETTLYRVTFSYPKGHQTNPEVIELGKHQIELYGDGGSGYYYSWTTSEPGILTFEVDPSTIVSYNISSTKDTTVSSSTNNGVATDFVSYVELVIGQGHLNESKDGTVTVTINLGNPSTDSANKTVVPFRLESYRTKVADDTTVKVAAGQTYRLMQMLTDTSAAGMIISGADSFKVVYDGAEYASVNGRVEIKNFSTGRTYFQIINNSAEEQTYTVDVIYPVIVTDSTTVIAAAGETCYLKQDLADTSATDLIISGNGAFEVIYNGETYIAESGTVNVSNFAVEDIVFYIVNRSGEEQSYSIVLKYPLGTAKNPEVMEAGVWNMDLYTFTEYYYTWTAPADGTFTFALPAAADRYKPWSYEITYGGQTTPANGKTSMSVTVSAGDVVSVKIGRTRDPGKSLTVTFSMDFAANPAVSQVSVENEVSGSMLEQMPAEPQLETVAETESVTEGKTGDADVENAAEETESATETEPAAE